MNKSKQLVDENREAIEAMILVMDEISHTEICDTGAAAEGVMCGLRRILKNFAPEPELEEGWYWYCESGHDDAMTIVWREDSAMRYRIWQGSACLPVSKATGTFEGPLKPAKKKSQPKDNER